MSFNPTQQDQLIFSINYDLEQESPTFPSITTLPNGHYMIGPLACAFYGVSPADYYIAEFLSGTMCPVAKLTDDLQIFDKKLNEGGVGQGEAYFDSETGKLVPPQSGGGGGSAPVGQIIYGTGDGSSSSDALTYDGTTLEIDSGTDGVSGLKLPGLKLQPSISASLFSYTGAQPSAISIDSLGNVYTKDNQDKTITKITPDGIQSVLGSIQWEQQASRICFDGQQNLYVSDGYTVKKFYPDGSFAIIPFFTDTDPVSIVEIAVSDNQDVYALTNDNTGNLYKSTEGGTPEIFQTIGTDNYRELILTTDGIFYAIGQERVVKILQDGSSSILATFSNGQQGGSTVIDSFGNLYCASEVTSNNIFKITPEGTITTVYSILGGYSRGIGIDSSDNIYFVDFLGGDVFKMTPDGVTSVIANTGAYSVELVSSPDGILFIPKMLANQVMKVGPSTIPSVISVDDQGNTILVDIDLSYTTSQSGGTINTSVSGLSAAIPVASTQNAGLMAPEDKAKLDGLPATISIVNETTAGLMAPEDKVKLDGLDSGQSTIIGDGATGTNGASVAIGNGANATSNGVSIGVNTNSTNNGTQVGFGADGNDNGSSVGILSKGFTYGAGLGRLSDGSNYGAAVGYNTIAFNQGAALGYFANGSNCGLALGNTAGSGIANRIEIAPKNAAHQIRARISGQSTNTAIQFTAPQSNTAPTDAPNDFTNADGTLPRGMIQISINAAGTGLIIFANIGGVIKSGTISLT